MGGTLANHCSTAVKPGYTGKTVAGYIQQGRRASWIQHAPAGLMATACLHSSGLISGTVQPRITLNPGLMF